MKKRKHLTQREVERLLQATQSGRHPERDYCLIYMCFIHGCRVSELSSWRLSDVDLEEGSVYMHRLKNGLSTMHPLLSKEKKALQLWLSKRNEYMTDKTDLLFLSSRGTPITRDRFYQIIRHYSLKAKLAINAHPHMLRHACGFALADRGVDTRLIQDYLGHKNIRHTVLYTASNCGRFRDIW